MRAAECWYVGFGEASTSPAQARLEEAFGALPVWLAAENGIFIRPPGDAWITLLQARKRDTITHPLASALCLHAHDDCANQPMLLTLESAMLRPPAPVHSGLAPGRCATKPVAGCWPHAGGQAGVDGERAAGV